MGQGLKSYKLPPVMGVAVTGWIALKASPFSSLATAASAGRALEQLRLVLAEVQMATVRNQVLLSMFTDFENFSVFKPGPTKEQSVNDMLDQLIAWGGALQTLRKKTA